MQQTLDVNSKQCCFNVGQVVRDTDQKLVPLGGTKRKFYTFLDMPGACQKCMMDI